MGAKSASSASPEGVGRGVSLGRTKEGNWFKKVRNMSVHFFRLQKTYPALTDESWLAEPDSDRRRSCSAVMNDRNTLREQPIVGYVAQKKNVRRDAVLEVGSEVGPTDREERSHARCRDRLQDQGDEGGRIRNRDGAKPGAQEGVCSVRKAVGS